MHVETSYCFNCGKKIEKGFEIWKEVNVKGDYATIGTRSIHYFGDETVFSDSDFYSSTTVSSYSMIMGTINTLNWGSLYHETLVPFCSEKCAIAYSL